MIWEGGILGGESDMMTLIDKDKTLEDESESGDICDEGILAGSDGICDEALVGNTHGPHNLEMTSVLNQMKW